MKTRTLLILTTAGVLLGATALAAAAQPYGPGGCRHDGPAVMRGTGFGPGAMTGPRAGARLLGGLDRDGDGTVTLEEARATVDARLATHDADGDGVLVLDEFAALHAAAVRPRMIDRFQAFDEDGDGRVTPEEMRAPVAFRLQRMDRDGDGAVGPDDRRGPVADGRRGGRAQTGRGDGPSYRGSFGPQRW